VHTQTDHIAFDHQLPVLCEKPIAEDFAEAVEVVGRAQVEGLPFMIAENYRRMAIMRRARQLLEEGAIGTLRSLHCVHYRSLYTEKPYFLRMKHPYLVDVVVHHLDLIRYLSGSEGRWIFARSYRPAESWHPGNLALDLSMEMENGVTASFSGNLITFGSETDWRGDWRIEGTMGTLVVTGKRICIFQGGKAVQVEDPGEKESLEDFQTPGPLVDFLAALKSNQEPETSARDYLKTQALVHFAIQSSETNRVIEVSLPQI
jgi:predicted dehydrogenase